MKNIANPVYENLTPEQRVRATVAAVARDDQAEIKRLRETCPKKTYRMNDAAFADRMETLMAVSLAIECDLRGLTIDFFAARLPRNSTGEKDMNSLVARLDHIDDLLAQIATIEEAWNRIIEGLGIDREDIAKAGPPRHPATKSLVRRAIEVTGWDEEQVCELVRAFEEHFRQIA